MQYSQKVMDHFMNPRNVGKVNNPNGVGEVGNPTCGDIMHIEIEVTDDVIKDTNAVADSFAGVDVRVYAAKCPDVEPDSV